MKKLFGVLFLVFVLGEVSFADTTDISNMMASLDGSLNSIFTSITSNLSVSIDNNMQFYGSAGNIYNPNVSPYFGLKFGIGLGFNVSSLVIDMIQGNDFDFTSGLTSSDSNASIFDEFGTAVGTLISLVPLPYDLVYVKVGLPESFLHTPITKYMDVGIRIGVLPNIADLLGDLSESEGALSGSISLSTAGFHFGAEARTLLLGKPKSLFNLDLRGSFDLDLGGIGTEASVTYDLDGYTNSSLFTANFVGTFGMKFVWRGANIGVKSIASLNFRIIKFYAGLGLNMYAGSVKSEMYLKGDMDFGSVIGTVPFYDKDIKYISWYDMFDARALAGFNLLGFFNTGIEYSLTRGTIAVTVIPFSMAF